MRRVMSKETALTAAWIVALGGSVQSVLVSACVYVPSGRRVGPRSLVG